MEENDLLENYIEENDIYIDEVFVFNELYLENIRFCLRLYLYKSIQAKESSSIIMRVQPTGSSAFTLYHNSTWRSFLRNENFNTIEYGGRGAPHEHAIINLQYIDNTYGANEYAASYSSKADEIMYYREHPIINLNK